MRQSIAPSYMWLRVRYYYKMLFHSEQKEEQILWNYIISPEGKVSHHILPETHKEVRAFLNKNISKSAFLEKYQTRLSHTQMTVEIGTYDIRKLIFEYPETIAILKEFKSPDGVLVKDTQDMEAVKSMLSKYDSHNELKHRILSPLTTHGIAQVPRMTRFFKLFRDGLRYYTIENAPYVLGLFAGLRHANAFANIIFLLTSTCRYLIKQSTDEMQIVQDRLSNVKTNTEAQIVALMKAKIIPQSLSKKVMPSSEFNQILYIVTRVWEVTLDEISKSAKKVITFEKLPQLKTSEISLNMISALAKYLGEVRKLGGVFHYDEDISEQIIKELSAIFVKNLSVKSRIGDGFAKFGLTGMQYLDHISIHDNTIFNIIEYVCEKSDASTILSETTKDVFKENFGNIIQSLSLGKNSTLSKTWNKVYELQDDGKYNEAQELTQHTRIMESLGSTIATTALARSSNTTIKLIQFSSDFISYWICAFANQLLLNKWFQSNTLKAVITYTGFKFVDGILKNLINRYEMKIINDHKLKNEVYEEFNLNLIDVFKKHYHPPAESKLKEPKNQDINFIKRFKTYNYIMSETLAKTIVIKKIKLDQIEGQDLSIIGMCLFNSLAIFMKKECAGKLLYKINKQGANYIAESFATILSGALEDYGGRFELNLSSTKLKEYLSKPLEPYLESCKIINDKIKEKVKEKAALRDSSTQAAHASPRSSSSDSPRAPQESPRGSQESPASPRLKSPTASSDENIGRDYSTKLTGGGPEFIRSPRMMRRRPSQVHDGLVNSEELQQLTKDFIDKGNAKGLGISAKEKY